MSQPIWEGKRCWRQQHFLCVRRTISKSSSFNSHGPRSSASNLSILFCNKSVFIPLYDPSSLYSVSRLRIGWMPSPSKEIVWVLFVFQNRKMIHTLTKADISRAYSFPYYLHSMQFIIEILRFVAKRPI